MLNLNRPTPFYTFVQNLDALHLWKQHSFKPNILSQAQWQVKSIGTFRRYHTSPNLSRPSYTCTQMSHPLYPQQSPQSNSILFPLTNHPPTTLPSTYPTYAPVTTVIGHLCHSLSQSNGIGTAPNHAPRNAPTAAPNTSSNGLYTDNTSFHFSVEEP